MFTSDSRFIKHNRAETRITVPTVRLKARAEPSEEPIVRILLCCRNSESDIVYIWVHRESNLMFTLSSDKHQRKRLSMRRFRSVWMSVKIRIYRAEHRALTSHCYSAIPSALHTLALNHVLHSIHTERKRNASGTQRLGSVRNCLVNLCTVIPLFNVMGFHVPFRLASFPVSHSLVHYVNVLCSPLPGMYIGSVVGY